LLLNLGCGRKKLPDHINIDSCHLEAPDVVCDLGTETWPWPTSSMDAGVALHVLEHLPGDAFYHFLRELYRVSKPGAVTTIVLPHPSHDIYLQDPTHARPVLPGTMAMFSRAYVGKLAARGDFLTDMGERIGVDFDLGRVSYTFDASVDPADPELAWKAKHLRNILFEWSSTLTAVK